jgi:hypothetical protein
MLVRLHLWLVCLAIDFIKAADNEQEQLLAHLPFCMIRILRHRRMCTTTTLSNDDFVFVSCLVVMQPHTIINQTLHSYCKEQIEFNAQPMFINLTE